MITSGFFNASGQDRAYSADDMNKMFEGLITEGIIGAIGNNFVVSSPSGMTLQVGSGKAWYINSWIESDASYTVNISAAHASLDRIDTVALNFDKTDEVRANTIVVVKGTPSGSPVAPTLLDTSTNKQVPLAHISVASGVTEILEGDITSVVGTLDSPFVTGLVDQADIANLLQNWDADFQVWIASMQDALTDPEAVSLQNQVNFLYSGLNRRDRNILINGDMRVAQRGVSATGITGSDNTYKAGPDRWKFRVADQTAIFSKEQGDVVEESGKNRKTLKITTTTAGAGTGTAHFARIHQRIAGDNLRDSYMGFYSEGPKTLTLSFKREANYAGVYAVEILAANQHFVEPMTITIGESGSIIQEEVTIPVGLSDIIQDSSEAYALTVIFWLNAGTDYTSGVAGAGWGNVVNANRAAGVTGFGDTIGEYFSIWDVQLEIGSVRTPFEYIPYDEALRKCRRYYERVQGYFPVVPIDSALAGTTDTWTVPGLRYNVSKLAAPTLVNASGLLYYSTGGGLQTPAMNNLSLAGDVDGGYLSFDTSSAINPGYGIMANIDIGLESEL